MANNLVLASAVVAVAACAEPRLLAEDLDMDDVGVSSEVPAEVFVLEFDGSEGVLTTCGDIRRRIPPVYDGEACVGRQPDESGCFEGERSCVPDEEVISFPPFEGGYGQGRGANVAAITSLLRCSFKELTSVVFRDGTVQDGDVNRVLFGGVSGPNFNGYGGQFDSGNEIEILVPEWVPVVDGVSFQQLPCQIAHLATREIAMALGAELDAEGANAFEWPPSQLCLDNDAWNFSPHVARRLVENTATLDMGDDARRVAADSLTSIGTRCENEINSANPLY